MMLTKHFSSQKSKEGQDFFVSVDDPQILRREVLLASKGALDILRSLEVLQSVRGERQKVQDQLRHTFAELVLLNRQLRSFLPKSIPSVPSPVVSVPKPEERVEVPVERSRLERLEEELAAIERKLSALE